MLARVFLIVGLIALLSSQGLASIEGKEVTYQAGGVPLKGYLCFDNSKKEKRPGVLVVHEWWGQNEYARRRARMLAELGYTALAVDMYGEGKLAEHPNDAAKFAKAATKNTDIKKARFLAAMDLLKKHPTVHPDKLAAIGYCFGGGVVLDMARLGLDLDAVASFHGSLRAGNAIAKEGMKAKILVCHGEADHFTSPEQIAAFKAEMKSAGADIRFISYPGAKHGFTNPEADDVAKKFKLDVAYDATADQKSWKAMQDLFKEVLK